MRQPRQERILAVLCTLGSMLCFSSIPVFLRHFAKEEHQLDPWTVNAVRYSVAAVFWLPFVVILSRRVKAGRVRLSTHAPGGPPVRSIWLAAVVPAVVNTAGQIGWAAAPYHAKASTIGFVIRTSFLFTMLLGFIFLRAERALARRPAFYGGAAVSMLGVLLMWLGTTWGRSKTTEDTAAGLAIIVFTALCWGGYAVSIRHFLAGYPLRLAFGVISLYTAGTLVVLMLRYGTYGRLATLPWPLWAMVLVSGFVGIALGHVLYYRGIHGIGPVVASGMTLGAPFVTALAAAVFLRERMTATQLLGGLAVVGGGVALVRAKVRATPVEAELPRAGR